MVGASKILTVSYGTFSCTLEGFDEPFSTMKAIAEYFRDLAADDRYFGAEPPTPDAEMLHRIAEREIQRRVDAKIDANGIVLRPQELNRPAATDGEQSPTTAHAQADGPGVTAQPAAQVAPVAMPIEAATAAIAAAPAAPVSNDSVASKLQRIRAAVANARAAAPLGYVEDQHADAFSGADFNPSEDFGYALDLSKTQVKENKSAEAAPASVPDEAIQDMPSIDSDDDAAPLEAETAKSDLADLDALFAQDEDLPAEDEHSADLDEVTLLGEAQEDADILDTIVIGLDEAEALNAEAPQQEEALQGEAEIANATQDAPQDAPEAESLEETVEPDVDLADADAADPVSVTADLVEPADIEEAELAADTAEEDVARPEVAKADTVFGPTDDLERIVDEAAEQAPAYEAADTLDVEIESLALEDEAQSAQRIRARVLKVRRAETLSPETGSSKPDTDAETDDAAVLAAIGQSLAETNADDVTDLEQSERPVDTPENTSTSGLSAEAEAELMRELAELERENGSIDSEPIENLDWVDVPADVPAEEAADAPADSIAAGLTELVDGENAKDDEPAESVEGEDIDSTSEDGTPEPESIVTREPQEADLSRLLRETNSKLEGTENRRRFSAIAHLKAAVAATVADRKMRRSEAPVVEPAPEMDRYREDLTRAVHPRRPVSSGDAATRRPAVPEARPAPLVLVSEQRIDRDDPSVTAHMPVVRPRRISTTQITGGAASLNDDDDEDDTPPLSVEEAKSFADFAESLGVEELSDLLEAAAVYTATVEGRPHFSRPQIIKKVASLAEAGDYNREAGLRSFGKLLRQGKIAKIKRGQFAIAEQSRFYGEAKRANR